MLLRVPQGTVLSPLLYIIYVIGLSNLLIDGSLYSYADDTAILISNNTWDSAIKKVENSLKTIITWFSNNNLTLNNSKTVFLTFSNNSSTTPNFSTLKVHASNCKYIIHCNCPIINRVSQTKYLGITFDQHFRWNLHTSDFN